MTITPNVRVSSWRPVLPTVTVKRPAAPRMSEDAGGIVRSAGGLARRAGLLVVASLGVLALLQVAALASLDPLRTTVSELVYAPGGSVLFPLAGMMCLAGSVALTAVLVRRGAITVAAVLGVWCVGLLIATVCPTDPPTTQTVSLVAELHRDAAAAMFVALPIAGYLLAHRALREHRRTVDRRQIDDGASPALRLRRASIVCALAGIAQFAVSIPSLFAGTALAASDPALALFAVRGLAERLLFVAMIMVVIRMAQVLTKQGSLLHCGARAARPDWVR